MNEDVYNTIIYTDYTDLPKETQESLFEEWLSSCGNNEKAFFKTYKFFPLFLMAPLIPLAVALILAFIYGFTPVVIVFSIISFLCLAGFVFVSAKLDKKRMEHLEKYAYWLKTEKHVLAELKK